MFASIPLLFKHNREGAFAHSLKEVFYKHLVTLLPLWLNHIMVRVIALTLTQISFKPLCIITSWLKQLEAVLLLYIKTTVSQTSKSYNQDFS